MRAFLWEKGVTWNLNDLVDKNNITHVLNAIVDMPPVAGNHARFAFDFSPASIVLRGIIMRMRCVSGAARLQDSELSTI